MALLHFLAAILLVVLSACAHRIDYGLWGPIDDPHVILSVLRDRYARISSLRAEGRLSLESPRGSGSLRMALEVDKPGRIYLETADLFGTPRGTFSTDGERFVFYDPGENVYWVGPATAERLGAFLPVALPPEEIAALLLGQPALLESAEADLAIEPEGVYRIEVRTDRARQRIRVATRDLRLISVETWGMQAVDVEVLAHRVVETDLPVPAAMEIRERRSGTLLRIRLGDAEWNVAPEEDLFRIEPPPGAPIERLGAR